MTPFVIVLAILPGLIISYVIYRADKYEKEAKIPIVICFVLGVIVTFLALEIEKWAHTWGWEESGSLWASAGVSLLGVAIPEELVKFAALMAYPFFRPFFNEPMDGIVYAVLIGMGFATMENLMYADVYGMNTTVIRVFTAVPAHGVFAVMMGYYVGLAKFDLPKRWLLLLTGLGLAVGAHAAYDFFIIQQAYEWLTILALFTLIICIYFSQKLVKLHQQNSFFKPKETIAEVPNPMPKAETPETPKPKPEINWNPPKPDVPNPTPPKSDTDTEA